MWADKGSESVQSNTRFHEVAHEDSRQQQESKGDKKSYTHQENADKPTEVATMTRRTLFMNNSSTTRLSEMSSPAWWAPMPAAASSTAMRSNKQVAVWEKCDTSYFRVACFEMSSRF